MKPKPSISLSEVRGRSTWLSVVRAYLTCDSLLANQLAAVGIRMAEHEVLINLSQTPGMTQQELARHSFSAKSGISMLIAQMEARGLVERVADTQDARVKRVVLTITGQGLAEQALRIQTQLVACMTDDFTNADLAQIELVMLQVTERLQQRAAQAVT